MQTDGFVQGKQGPGAVVGEMSEASADEVKAFKELGEGVRYKAYSHPLFFYM